MDWGVDFVTGFLVGTLTPEPKSGSTATYPLPFPSGAVPDKDVHYHPFYLRYTWSLWHRVRGNPQIKGIPFGPDTHKITMYADDVIFSLADPEISLPAVIEELTLFGAASGFQLNLEKSIILNLSVPPPIRSQVQATLPIQWATQSIPYLGVSIASSLSTTAHLNYTSILTSTKADLHI